MEVSAMMPTRMHPTKKKPCCKPKNKAGPWLDGTLNTEYRNEFIDKEVPVQRAQRPAAQVNPGGKFDPSTTYGGDFKPYQTARAGMIKPPNSQTLEVGPFNGDSTYKQNFGPKAVPYERVRPNTVANHNQGEFYGTTTYGSNFQPLGVPVPAKMVQRSNTIDKTGPFEGESMYKSNFTKMPNAQRVPLKAQGGGQILPPGAFDGDTTYRTGYVPKEVEALQQFRPKDSRPMTTDGWQGGMNTEYRGQFIDKEVPAVEAAKPARGGEVLPKGALDTSTTYGGSFKPYAVPRATLTRPKDQDHEKLPFNGQSSYASAFIPKAVPYERVKPSNAYEPNKAMFDGSTTHKAAFQGYGVVPAFRGGPQREQRESLPFEGQSAYKSDFVKMPGAKRVPNIPKNSTIKTGPFDGNTTYRNDFVEKEIPAWERDCTDCDSDEDYQ